MAQSNIDKNVRSVYNSRNVWKKLVWFDLYIWVNIGRASSILGFFQIVDEHIWLIHLTLTSRCLCYIMCHYTRKWDIAFLNKLKVLFISFHIHSLSKHRLIGRRCVTTLAIGQLCRDASLWLDDWFHHALWLAGLKYARFWLAVDSNVTWSFGFLFVTFFFAFCTFLRNF